MRVALEVDGFARGRIDFNDGSTETHGTFGYGKAGGQSGLEAPNDGFGRAAQHRVIGAAHAGVSEVGGAVG